MVFGHYLHLSILQLLLDKPREKAGKGAEPIARHLLH